jgi:gliding motility-associated-like protein
VPQADFKYSPEHPVEKMDEVLFTNSSEGEGQISWRWFFNADPAYRPNAQQAAFVFAEAGNYPVVLVVKTEHGCADTVIKSIVIGVDFNVFVPNTFSPNNDGSNDVFKAVTRGVKLYNLQIFDRWGARIFSSGDVDAAWDGTYKGEPCKADVYTWTIDVSSTRGERKQLRGHVTLLR